MHVSMFAAALWLWSCLLASSSMEPAARAFAGPLFAGIASAIQMGLLGALITLAPRPFYAPHFLTTDAWGLTPLQDQQLGGAIMWVVGCSVFFAVALVGIAGALREPRHAPIARRRAAALRGTAVTGHG
jgi:putative membrane protein